MTIFETNCYSRIPNIVAAKKYSQSKILELQEALKEVGRDDISVVATGSYGRLEASEVSDIDFFVLTSSELDQVTADDLYGKIERSVIKVIGKRPSKDGAFGTVVKSGELGRVIGGNDDSNPLITRRILFLTEGRPITGRRLFDVERRNLVEAYVRDTISDHQLGLFLLNDIIRYYRTVCVDFENKTVQNKKPWGTRNIKLVFSRKMLYFGGVLICAEMAQKTANTKREIALQLMELTPVERCIEICGSSALRALEEYNHFLEQISRCDVREFLDGITEERPHPENFNILKNRGHHFTMTLISSLNATYPPSHPIHRALIM